MKWTNQPESVLLQRSFLFGITGIVLGTISLLNSHFIFYQAPMGPLNGVAILLQLIGLSLAVLVLRKRKISTETVEKAKVMTLILAVSLLFFILSI
ncbi:hypothetical protein [Algoriphagus hitonicola]|uniref:Uncharacterized protein n=1 Tax=Algoriphagus hitonicola TaxID=435880 RepID=A0A1I2NN52_9BACT|nr:hypothetical protein [Algoriphagus hitonicola]SFG02886.1 hypothetical protein SAMN04487988_101112 [Algoriphagus hitonicola]